MPARTFVAIVLLATFAACTRTTPRVVDGVMYVTSAWSIVHAIDARNGTRLWVYDPKVDHAVGAKTCCDVVNRGVAFYGGKVFVGVIDGRLVALDAASGSVAWETVTVDQSQAYMITGAPRAANGLVYIGNGGAELASQGMRRFERYLTPADAELIRSYVARQAAMQYEAERTGERRK